MVTLSPEELEQTKALRDVCRLAIEKVLNFRLLMVVGENQKRAFLDNLPELDKYVVQQDAAWVGRLNLAWEKQQACTDALRIRGDEAMRNGEAYKAYISYFACTFNNTVDPVNFTNKAAAALKLRWWAAAEQDATMALGCGIARGQSVVSQARYYRGRARKYMGWLEGAKEDLRIAALELPHDTTIRAEQAELNGLLEKTPEDLQAWLRIQGGVEFNKDKAESEASALRENVAVKKNVEPFPVNL